MPSGEIERPIQLDLLDQLIDQNPDSRLDEQMTRNQSLLLYRASVRRDLEWLLNSTRTIVKIPESYRELRRSLFTYGLPDITSYQISGPNDEAKLLRSLEETIEVFEPRLSNVRVIATTPLTQKAPALIFRIEALLSMDPAPERISFDTILEVARGSYEVKGE